jgi:hypothetical protein
MSKDLDPVDWSDEDNNVYYNPEDLDGLNIISLEDDFMNKPEYRAFDINQIQDKDYVLELYGKSYFNESTFDTFKSFIKDEYNIEIEWDI